MRLYITSSIYETTEITPVSKTFTISVISADCAVEDFTHPTQAAVEQNLWYAATTLDFTDSWVVSPATCTIHTITTKTFEW